MIELLPTLQTAVWALKTAIDIFHQLTDHKDQCRTLIDRCEELIVHTCAQLQPDSPARLDRELVKVKECVTATYFSSRDIDRSF